LSPHCWCCIVKVGCKPSLTKWGTRISLPTVSSRCDRPPIVNAACMVWCNEFSRKSSHFVAFTSKIVAYTWPKVVSSEPKKTDHPVKADLLTFISVELAQGLRHEPTGRKSGFRKSPPDEGKWRPPLTSTFLEDVCPAFVNYEEMNIPAAKHDTNPTEFFVLPRFLTKFSRVIASGRNLDCLTIHVLRLAV
ncbi:hypothetical protein T265_12672, partial [Opisthorchis viverrini]